MVLKSFAKLNLYLVVLNRGRDSYHTVDTVFERISLYDTITLTTSHTSSIRITSRSLHIPKNKMNLAWQAAALLRDTYGVKRGVHIHITKRIPVGSGMGGGSSNAACVLMGLNRLWRLGRSREELADLGKKLGADVPFFIYDTAFARGKARGDEITPLRQLKGLCLWHILVVPRISVSTSLVYKKWDEWHHHFRTLTIWRPDVKISLLAKKKGLPLIRKALFNSLEAVSVRLYPQIRQIKTALLELGVQVVLMSGSGPAVFGLVSSRKEALSLRRQLKKKCSWQVYTVRTI